MDYRIINPSHAREVANLAVCLTNEIIERTGIQHFDINIPLAETLCKKFMMSGQYTVVAAFDDDKMIGFGTLCESHALYAEGTFGIVQEFYVLPEYRSRHIGRDLLGEMLRFARDKNWKRLELCTPPVPEFDRTVTFYKANGFEITGGYKMKIAID